MTSEPDPNLQYAGPVAVLVSSTTFSAADFSSAILNLTGPAKTFGVPSGGGFGNRNTTDLDPAYAFSYNDIFCADMRGTALEGHPAAVDVPAQLAVADVLEGEDTVIEVARAWLAGE